MKLSRPRPAIRRCRAVGRGRPSAAGVTLVVVLVT
jgi:hypothetical protein